MTTPSADIPNASLDPQDWSPLRLQGHRMLDDMFDHLQGLREAPRWRAPPSRLSSPPSRLPHEPSDLSHLHASFLRDVLPYSSGNAHPGFMGWVQGGDAPVGMLAEMLAAVLDDWPGCAHAPGLCGRELAAHLGPTGRAGDD